eukprot:Skav208634  [mRNA]  locus=scaffold3433:221382:223664:- [translate_table: standard]
MTVFCALLKDPRSPLGDWDVLHLGDLLKDTGRHYQVEDYALLLTPLSFLLVCRLTRSAVRFYDARAAAGKLIETCRVLAGEAARPAPTHRAARCTRCRGGHLPMDRELPRGHPELPAEQRPVDGAGRTKGRGSVR